MNWRLVEPCCGSAAVTFRALGARKPVCAYQGGKGRLSRVIVEMLDEAGFHGAPSEVVLRDAGPWGIAAASLVNPSTRAKVYQRLEALAQENPAQVYQQLHRCACPIDHAYYTAEFLFLQRLSHSGKAVSGRGGRWYSPGFNRTSAYGTPGTERFGEVRPQIQGLLDRIREMDSMASPPADFGHGLPWPEVPRVEIPTAVYLDPPYLGVTVYPDGKLSRLEVVGLAHTWAVAGAWVGVSEAEPVQELVDLGWKTRVLAEPRDVNNRFHSKRGEILTFFAGS